MFAKGRVFVRSDRRLRNVREIKERDRLEKKAIISQEKELPEGLFFSSPLKIRQLEKLERKSLYGTVCFTFFAFEENEKKKADRHFVRNLLFLCV